MSTASDRPPQRPSDESFEQLGFRPRPATRWLAPRQYVATTLQTALAGVAGAFTDRRETLAALDPRPAPAPDVDLSDRGELWFDYVADTGDGFSHTYPVARALADEHLAVDGLADPLPPGRLLVMGGDEVYPVASDEDYRDRLVGPFRAAAPWRADDDTRHLVAIPGNHDWYDGLGSFSRSFCQQRWIGAWESHQHRSYFAVRLPHHWWMWGVDIALAGLVDQAQLEYFDAMAALAQSSAAAAGATPRLVIVTAKPSWLDAVESAPREVRSDPALDHLEHRVAAAHGMRVAAVVAGDKHFYARYEPEGDGPTRLVSGGGGAFLHPTDHRARRLSVAHVGAADDEHLSLESISPSADESRRLRLRALWFGFRNGAFPFVTAAAYLAWLVPTPARVVVAAAALCCTIALARRPSAARALPWAVPHAAAHVGCMIGAIAVADAAMSGDPSIWWRAVALAAAGGLVAPVVVGVYFVIVGTIAGVNDNEAFAAIRVRDHKGFLRFHLDRHGSVRMYAIGIDGAPDRDGWRLETTAPPGDPWFGTASPPTVRLLDGPVDIGP